MTEDSPVVYCPYCGSDEVFQEGVRHRCNSCGRLFDVLELKMLRRSRHVWGEPDSLVRCLECGREAHVNFAFCLKHGWPKCCGLTMDLVNTEADIEEAVETIAGKSLAMLRRLIKGG